MQYWLEKSKRKKSQLLQSNSNKSIMTIKEFQKMRGNYLNKVRWFWVKLYTIHYKIKLLVYIKKIKNLSILLWGIFITWVMKDPSGLEILHRKWKSFLIQVQHGLGYFLKNVGQVNVHLEIKSSNIINHQNFNKISKVDNFLHTAKVQSSVTQPLTKSALPMTVAIACTILHF